MKKYGISVLFSVYKKENAEYLREAVESIIKQTRPVDEIVIIEDGPLTETLYAELNYLEEEYGKIIKRYALKENMGLGLALKFGVEKCSHELIARMDTDDIAVPNRIEMQEKAFLEDFRLDIVGGHIEEFDTDPNAPHSKRAVPLTHKHIAKYQKMRSAFNHMTVMFKKSAVLRAGNYEDGLYMEDDLLWHNMLQTASKMKNLDMTLCKVRVGNGMYQRRGGLDYFEYYKEARKKMLDRKQISHKDYLLSLSIQLGVASVPNNTREFIFKKLLRK
ncbi:MAG: glycosyltransferase [Gemella sp.]|nr:glycosyltransferase [Gemella sp.]